MRKTDALFPQNANGYNMAIPMPGHPIPSGSIEQAKKDVQQLEALFDDHDVVFLLMDSRESRWLPTVLGAAKGKVGQQSKPFFSHHDATFITSDSDECRPGIRHLLSHATWGPSGHIFWRPFGLLLLQRHRSTSRCAFISYCRMMVCYLRRSQSLTDRTLDQMCTVTRPGLASIAASTAVELLVSLLQHPDGYVDPTAVIFIVYTP